MPAFRELNQDPGSRAIRYNAMFETKTDENGHFSVPTTSTQSYDLSLDRYDFGPEFRNDLLDGTSPTIVLHPGAVITGRVTRIIGSDFCQPLRDIPIKLLLPNPDGFWYQQRTVTDEKGKYTLHGSYLQESDQRWQIQFLNEDVSIDIDSNKPIAGPDFEITIHTSSVTGTRQ